MAGIRVRKAESPCGEGEREPSKDIRDTIVSSSRAVLNLAGAEFVFLNPYISETRKRTVNRELPDGSLEVSECLGEMGSEYTVTYTDAETGLARKITTTASRINVRSLFYKGDLDYDTVIAGYVTRLAEEMAHEARE